jgi:drug/metabolite transporter (DMT)-like permease
LQLENIYIARSLTYRNYLLLHLIVLLWGFSPVLGKLISVQEYQLVWWRMVITTPVILGYLLIAKVSLRIGFKALCAMLGIGIIVAAHWIMFYGAIKASNVSVTMAAFSCGALFTAFIEPIFYRRRIDPVEIFFGLMIIAGIAMIFHVETEHSKGIIMGVLAALGSSLFTVLNGLLVQKGHKAATISFIEIAGGLAVLTLYGVITGQVNMALLQLSPPDWGWLLILSLACTAFTFIISVDIMKVISPYTVNLTVNLETVYGIILAYFIFGSSEKMSLGFYLGAGLILATVLANGALKYYKRRKISTLVD